MIKDISVFYKFKSNIIQHLIPILFDDGSAGYTPTSTTCSGVKEC